MKAKSIILISIFLSVLSFTACTKKNVAKSSAQNPNIEFVTSPSIGRLTPIQISFINLPKCPIEEAVVLSPKVSGSWEYTENKATFTPDKPYKASSKITLKADCKKLFQDDSGIFQQIFYVENPSLKVDFDELRLNDSDKSYTLSGSLTTDIPVGEKIIAKLLNAKLSSKKQTITWKHSDNPEKWNFFINVLSSPDKEKQLVLNWSGKKLGIRRVLKKYLAGKKIIRIPAQTVFSIVDINTSKKNMILVSFSKTLDAAQDIASFIKSLDFNGKKTSDFSATIHGNTLSLFNDTNWNNVQTVAFENGIKSSDGMYLAKSSSVQLSNKWDIPSVKFMNSNVILPTSQGTLLPIETKNLTGVLIQVYQIYERNINQFLQDNELDQTRNLYRVGEPVWEKKIQFNWNESMQNKYIPRGLDLTDLVKNYTGGMYHIRISFRHDQIKYSADSDDYSSLPMPKDSIEPYSIPNERSSWDYWENLNYDQRNEYWRNRKNPHHPAFYIPNYNSDNTISRNILVSDLGIMAKKDSLDSIYVTVTDLKTAKPLQNVMLELTNYVGSHITSGKTDANGNAVFENQKGTFVICAKQNNQTSYLKLSEGTNLSTSHFEIGGEEVTNGQKGFIYGERGVWRPGNLMYLTFILQDLEKKLPREIPVRFELSDPMGRITDTQILDKSENYFYPILTKTADDAPTGLWTAKVSIGGKSWTKSLSVEAIVPNKLSVSLDSEKDYLSPQNNTFTLSGAYLHGAPIPNFSADVSVAFSKAETVFDGYSEYTFSNLSNQIDYNRREIWSGKLDKDSKAKFTAFLNAGNELPGKLNAHFISKIYEPSGAFSTQSKTIPYSPFDRYVGIKLPKGDASRNMLLTDTDHTVDVVLLTPDGKTAQNATLEYKVYKIEWKWWWEKDAYSSATHISSRYYSKVAAGKVTAKNGRGSFKFQVKYPDWGRYLVEVSDGNSGHSASKIVYIDWPGWAGRAQEGGTGSAAMVPLTSDKKVYAPGDTAEISFTSNSQSSAYICLEKGGRIIKTLRIDTIKGTNVYKLPITKDFAPNVYVHLSLVQPHLQTANSLPIRLYGVLPIMVDDPQTKLFPVIECQSQFEPSKKASFSVSEKYGKPMTYTLAVVDEGLLGLTNYHAPDVRGSFYKKEASRLQNWDIYKYVMNAYSGKLETILAVGGSEDILDNAKNNENRFTPVVRYFGPFSIAPGEKKKTEFEMPYYIGAVRAIVIAGNEGAYGTQEKSIPVKSSLMAQPSLPRTLGTNETVSVPITVFNGDNYAKTVSVTFAARGILNFSKNETLTIPANEKSVVTFTVNTKAQGHVLFETTVKDETSSSKSSVPMEIVSRGIPVVYKKDFIVKSGSSSVVSTETPSEKGKASLSIELSTLPKINLNSRLNYLVHYPHGCIEQITSGAFPQLYITDFAKLSPSKISEIKENVISVFERYPTYQTAEGAMGYWPGSQIPHAWGTAYAVHFIIEAKNHGYSVPQNILNPALEYLSSSAANWQSSSDTDTPSIQAYRLFVLALAGRPDIGAMNRLYMNDFDSKDAQLLLAAAYSLVGRKDTADDILKKFNSTSFFFRSSDRDFSSSLRENAIQLFARTKTYSSFTPKTDDLAKTIAETLASDKWLNTQETAWSLFALLPYYVNKKTDGGSYKISNDMTSKTNTFTEASVLETLPVSYKSAGQSVKIENTGTQTLYGTLTCSGISAAGEEHPQNMGITLTTQGFNSGYNSIKNCKAGEEISLKIRVANTSKKDLQNLVLAIPIGTCLEFTNERVGNESYSNSSYTYQDIRDDVIYTYFDLKQNQEREFTFGVTAACSGNFTVPAIYAESMYDDSIRAVVPGFRVQMLK